MRRFGLKLLKRTVIEINTFSMKLNKRIKGIINVTVRLSRKKQQPGKEKKNIQNNLSHFCSMFSGS